MSIHPFINPFRHICSIASHKLLLRIPRVYQANGAHVFENHTIHESIPGVGGCDSTLLTKPNRTKTNSLTPYALKPPFR